jgi:hypothetical protein
MEDLQEDDIFNRENLRRALRFTQLKTFQPVGGAGTIADFEVTIPGLLKLRDCKLRRRAGDPIRLTTGRLDSGGFAVELRSWLRDAILAGAIAAVREKYQKELDALEAVDEEADVPPHVPGLDVSALPAQLMRAVR